MIRCQPIVSSANPRFKRLLDLTQRSTVRRELSLAVIEGEHLLSAWLEHAADRLVEVYLCAGGPQTPGPSAACLPAGIEVFELAEPLFRRASSLDNSPGPIALVRLPQGGHLPHLEHDAVYLDRLQDPGNAGTILRSAIAFGVRTVLASPGSVDLWSPKVLRAAMGAHPLLEILQGVDLEQLLVQARIPVCATSSHAGLSVSDADLRLPRIWIFGSEGAGVDLRALEGGGVQWLRIEQHAAMESLNVSVAASICLYEQFRQRRRAASS